MTTQNLFQMALWKYNLLPCFEKQLQNYKNIYNKVSIISKQR